MYIYINIYIYTYIYIYLVDIHVGRGWLGLGLVSSFYMYIYVHIYICTDCLRSWPEGRFVLDIGVVYNRITAALSKSQVPQEEAWWLSDKAQGRQPHNLTNSARGCSFKLLYIYIYIYIVCAWFRPCTFVLGAPPEPPREGRDSCFFASRFAAVPRREPVSALRFGCGLTVVRPG
jgi:hypothetical protein